MAFDLPEKIYLQVSDEYGQPLEELGDCTWCHERINVDDVEYVILPPYHVIADKDQVSQDEPMAHV